MSSLVLKWSWVYQCSSSSSFALCRLVSLLRFVFSSLLCTLGQSTLHTSTLDSALGCFSVFPPVTLFFNAFAIFHSYSFLFIALLRLTSFLSQQHTRNILVQGIKCVCCQTHQLVRLVWHGLGQRLCLPNGVCWGFQHGCSKTGRTERGSSCNNVNMSLDQDGLMAIGLAVVLRRKKY